MTVGNVRKDPYKGLQHSPNVQSANKSALGKKVLDVGRRQSPRQVSYVELGVFSVVGSSCRAEHSWKQSLADLKEALEEKKREEETNDNYPKIVEVRTRECSVVVVVGIVGPSSTGISSCQAIEVVLHHGGKLVNDGKLMYEGGERHLGASVLDDKLESLCDDIAAMHMVNLARFNGEVHMFVIHPISEPEVIHKLEYVINDERQVEERMSDVDGEQQEMGEQQVEVEVVMEEEVHGLEQVGGVLEEMGDVDGQVEVEAVMEEEVHEVEEVGGVLEQMPDVDGEVQVQALKKLVVMDEGEEMNEVEQDVEIRSWNSSFDSGSGDGNNECLEGLVDVNVGCDIDDDIHADLEGNVEVEVQSMSNDFSGPCFSGSFDNMFDVNIEGGNDRGGNDRELISGADSDEGDNDVEGYETFATFVLPKNWSDNKLFDVCHMSDSGDKFVVNIDDSSCTCRTWIITGIPCCHSLAAMKLLNIDGEQFIDSCYMKSICEETYSSIIYPINGANMWNITPYPDVSPPHKRVFLGRPKKKRRLEQWEIRKDDSRMTKSGLRKRCGMCSRCPSATQAGPVHCDEQTPSTQQSEIVHQTQPQA
ncbi:hypothetical protein V8G54_014588 [Vigna mungo]|uniref:SWIM-type domain-containing protein n=1 Tax=Vigna mungo TaxID=3915 RepID=A0AAQ3NKW7_VIGMU